MKLSDFGYELPKELIAQYPLKGRTSSRLMVLDRKDKTITHRRFYEISDYFKKGDLLILNDTKVIPCRLNGKRKSGGSVELLLLKNKAGLIFEALIKPARLKIFEEVIFPGSKITARLISKGEVEFNAGAIEDVYAIGCMPLPPYIKREPEESDFATYQTVYAKNPGAVAAPTGGLHFSADLLSEISSMGVISEFITLHVGYGTFKPVKSSDIREHKMHGEYFQISPRAETAIKHSQANSAKRFCVGTTSLRALEAYALGQESGFTDIFIYPGYKFKLADCLITNFHLPHTTLFMLVSAFAGLDFIKRAYQEAVDNKYRFYSYGDAMLII